jgi:osmotically-inducible protein OsmY
MSKSSNISKIVAASILAACPIAYSQGLADNTTESSRSMDESVEQGQSAVKDAWLHGRLESALLFNEELNSFDIDTDVRNGVASLKGAVESDIDRNLAGEIAESIEGISGVSNELVVDKAKANMASRSEMAREREGFKQSVLNATLTARIKSQLLMNGNTTGTDINVDSKDGIVTLSGSVETDEEKELAIRIASNTSGAQSVNDRLTVEPAEEAE